MIRPVLSPLLLVAFLPFASGGCGSAHRVVILQHPQTKQTVQCMPLTSGGPSGWQIASCVRRYEKAGYTVIGDSDE